MEGAAETDILESFLEMLKPIKCSNSSERFSDLSSMDKHVLISKTNFRITTPNVFESKRTTAAEWRNELRIREKIISGSKNQLQKRLEGSLVTEKFKKYIESMCCVN